MDDDVVEIPVQGGSRHCSAAQSHGARHSTSPDGLKPIRWADEWVNISVKE